jgi:hypothetical protein
LFFFIVDVAPEWENWKLALPQTSDNHVLCFSDPVNAKGELIKVRPVENKYRVFTVAELRRRIPHFWSQTVVLMDRDRWMPMDSADPFNLLGFTCLPVVKTVTTRDLPLWADVPKLALAVSIVKPNYVSTPVATCQLQPYEPVPPPTEPAPRVDSSPPPLPQSNVLEAFETPEPVPEVTLKMLKLEPTIAHARDFIRAKVARGRAIGLNVTLIMEAYYLNEQNIAYLCDIESISESLWIAENLLECLEFKDPGRYVQYQKALFEFKKLVPAE